MQSRKSRREMDDIRCGLWKTKNGLYAEVGYRSPSLRTHHWVGTCNGGVMRWTDDGLPDSSNRLMALDKYVGPLNEDDQPWLSP